MRRLKTLCFIAVSSMAAACGSSPSGEDGMDTAPDKSDQISGKDDPSGLLAGAERRLSKLVTAADIGREERVSPDRTPYTDTYWPMVDNGVASQWLEKSGAKCRLTAAPPEQGGGEVVHACTDPQPSPLEKLMTLISPDKTQAALDWERTRHGKLRPGVQDWFGHCPGWVASSLLNSPIKKGVTAKFDGTKITKCAAGEAGCVKFELGDLNALSAEAHEGAQSNFIGARCDTAPDDIQRDEFGRIIRNGKGCKGLNPGSMMIILGNRIKMQRLPFAIDAQNEFTTNQIWNQPAFGYKVNRFEPIDEVQAANMVATGSPDTIDTDQRDYIWNANANGFVLVDFTLLWVGEVGPNVTPVSPQLFEQAAVRETRMVAVVELDRDASDPEARIIGGEYLDDAAVDADRLRNAPFAWIATGPGIDGANARHNPHISSARIAELWKLALEP
jgi:hypothetical protein